MVKLYKIMFFNSMILGTLIAISSFSWLGMWMGLEINLLSIIPLMNSSKNMLSSEASLKYFITQTLASLVLMLSITLMMIVNEFITPMVNSQLTMLLNSALLTKLGAAPFHFWFPEVIEGLNWFNCSILLTWQKIAPMALLMNNHLMINFIIIIILMSLMVSTLMSLNQLSLRKIMAFSSINHIAWMMSAMISSFSIWMIYLMIYTFITLTITYTFNHMKINLINQIPLMLNSHKMFKFSMMANFMSLGGLPPFLGFLPKWLTINWMIIHNFTLLALILIIATLIMLFVYIRILTSSLLLSHNETKKIDFKMNKFLALSFNFFAITGLASCTLIFSLL
uniref:NADH-ubiquinone oxidoreductase chain 2 n=1 Tax=Epicauta impressicornis TaxID=1884679 RepID=A0A5Q0TZY4_9CUCU|nr:NADH dehydrogenase subunit 2 [Epicauta impressicornis]QGA73696.1 NADH dehydrogenase subunit 2 [Epicauta impressicornis]